MNICFLCVFIFLELDEESFNDNDLPVGWKMLNHHSGMPVYLNEEMKVCTFAKPYFLGVNSLKVSTYSNYPCFLISFFSIL